MSQLTIPQAFDLAVAHHQAGRLQPAEQLYRQILAQQPRHADALHLLGVIAHQVGRDDVAVDLIRRAIALNPNFPGAYNNLALALKAQGALPDAIAACRQAIALNPTFADAYNNLGNALGDHGDLAQAIAALRQAVALNPTYAVAHNNLGTVLRENAQLADAVAAFRQAIALTPNYPEAYSNLAAALRDQGQLDDAIAASRQAIAQNPNFPEAHSNLGNALRDQGQLDQAVAAFRRAIALNPKYAEAYSNLVAVLAELGRIDEALAACRQAIALKPDYPEAHYNLGNALRDQGEQDQAIAAYRQAIALRPTYADAYNNLGNALKDNGSLREASAAYRQAAQLNPDFAGAHSNLILSLHYDPDQNPAALAHEHRQWQLQHAEPLRALIAPHANDRSPTRRLRIGYVSPDLRTHPVGRFLLPLLAHHDQTQFEIFAYAQVPVPDEMTQQLRAHTAGWRSTVGLSDAAVADLVRKDGIDILVDLAMHSAHHRLLVFARKPAPVQVTYLAYCSTTGLDTIDYRLTDPYLDPPGMDESIYTEKTIRLPQTYWCYQPSAAAEAVGPLPALARGHLTFGCLNNFCKVSAPALAAWTDLLRAVPNSHLLLHAYPGAHRQRLLDQFAIAGIAPTRLTFAGRVPPEEYFRHYHHIDIALDTFPFAGGTTTCDALYMGVPVITLVGPTAVGRAGLSILSNLGTPELIAHSPDEYIHLATTLAADLPRLTHLRATLRERMQLSPLMDAPRFAHHIEAAYRQMWQTWCAHPSPLR